MPHGIPLRIMRVAKAIYKLGNIMTVVRSRTQGLRVGRSASHRKLWAFDLDISYMLRIRKDQCPPMA